jgi:hypothetical protein
VADAKHLIASGGANLAFAHELANCHVHIGDLSPVPRDERLERAYDLSFEACTEAVNAENFLSDPHAGSGLVTPEGMAVSSAEEVIRTLGRATNVLATPA